MGGPPYTSERGPAFITSLNAYFQNGHGLEEAQICLTKERAGRRRGRHQRSQLKIIQICLNYIIHISYKYYTNIIQMLYKYDMNISQILYKYQKNIIQICSTKEGAGRRRDADIGRHQNLASQLACQNPEAQDIKETPIWNAPI